MSLTKKVYRNLTATEKTIICETAAGIKNGVLFSATYFEGSDNVDNTSPSVSCMKMGKGLTDAIMWQALSQVIKENAELRSSINKFMQFEAIDTIAFDDVVRKIEFDNLTDEKVSCYNGVPPYLLRHIFDKCHFTIGQQKPLWQVFVIDQSMVVFHGHDVLFDGFAAATFHKLFLEALNSLRNVKGQKSDLIFKTREDLIPLCQSLAAEHNVSLISSVKDQVLTYSQTALKNLYSLAIKKPLRFIESGRLEHSGIPASNPYDLASYAGDLCGTVVFGNVNPERVRDLRALMNESKISFRSFIISVTMFCLLPVLEPSEEKIIFSVPINLRESIPWASDLGVFQNNVLFECPLDLIKHDIEPCSGISTFNQEFLEGSTLTDVGGVNEDQNDPQTVFRRILTHVTTELELAAMRLEKSHSSGEDLIKAEREARYFAASSRSKIVEINDLLEVDLSSKIHSRYKIGDVCSTSSRKSDTFMSISYCSSEISGLNLGIHYSEGFNMEYFVESFEGFLDSFPEFVC